MTKADRAKNTIILQIDNYAAAKDGALCHLYPGEKQITPYIKTGENGNGRTMVPVRFLAETMGATVLWDDATLTATITIGDDVLQMTIGSVVYTVNGETKTMDVPPETLYYNGESGYGRTMVPISFAAQALGKAVYWDNADRLVIITEQDLPWQDGRGAEAELKEDVLLVISPLLRDLIQ
ncbi:MAG TPA: copper amine oxidase N-terminal domain-containing protein [Candidatus Acidoferrum sp.]|nr:copper amine oxidase N-terminal domain-containing protein [Candidatus Acidoferrum sp.]